MVSWASTRDTLYEWYNWPKNFQGSNARDLLDAYPDYPVYAFVLYLVCVFYLPGFLKKRNLKWKLKYPVALWNLFLSVISMMGSYYLWGVLTSDAFRARSFYANLCEEVPLPDDDKLHSFAHRLHKEQWAAEPTSYKKFHPDSVNIQDLVDEMRDEYYVGLPAFFVAAFVYLKIPELLDTVFLILQGKPVSFLHWFHHILTAVYTWHSGYVCLTVSILFTVNNYTVHSIMYFYYFLVMLGLREKIRPIAPLITMLQCLQMFAGLYMTFYMYMQYWCGPSKEGTLFYEFWKLVLGGLWYAGHEVLSLWRQGALTAWKDLPVFDMEAHFYGCNVDRTNLRMASMMFGAYTILFCVLFYELYFLKTFNGKSLVVVREARKAQQENTDKNAETRDDTHPPRHGSGGDGDAANGEKGKKRSGIRVIKGSNSGNDSAEGAKDFG